MCGRYYIEGENGTEELRQIINAANRRSPQAPVKTGEVFPGDTAAVLANSRKLKMTAFAMRWGYALPNGKMIINARSETASEKPMFRDGILRRRCLIPASCYFEWERRQDGRVKYAIGEPDGEIIYMAGIYRIEKEKAVFTILTRAPADRIAFIHDRMPVILPKIAAGDWLNPECDANEVLRSSIEDVGFRPA